MSFAGVFGATLRLVRGLVCALLLLLPGAEAQPPPAEPEPPEQKELFALIHRQLLAFQKEDVDAIMATIHPESPLHDTTKALIEKVKDNYNLLYTVSELELELSVPEEARVGFTQLTEKSTGPQFRNNRIRGVHTFKKHDGQWKFFDSKVVKVEYFGK